MTQAHHTAPRRLWTFVVALGALAIATFVIFQAIEKKRINDLRWAHAAGETTGSVSQAAIQYGPSGLPLPRFVSLKSAKVNVRRGPSSDHGVAWVFQRKGMPVEITAEFENWRRIRDSDGQEGWILQQMLSGKRTLLVPASQGEKVIPLYESPDLTSPAVANLSVGVTGEVKECNGVWCFVSAGGYGGYVPQVKIWGVYPGETVE